MHEYVISENIGELVWEWDNAWEWRKWVVKDPPCARYTDGGVLRDHKTEAIMNRGQNLIIVMFCALAATSGVLSCLS